MDLNIRVMSPLTMNGHTKRVKSGMLVNIPNRHLFSAWPAAITNPNLMTGFIDRKSGWIANKKNSAWCKTKYKNLEFIAFTSQIVQSQRITFDRGFPVRIRCAFRTTVSLCQDSISITACNKSKKRDRSSDRMYTTKIFKEKKLDDQQKSQDLHTIRIKIVSSNI